MKRLRNDERGIAMMSVVLISFILAASGVSAYSVARHSLNSTGQNLKRVLSIGGAEAGLDIALSMLATAPLPCSVTGALQTSPTIGSYSVTITYYSGYPVTSGTALACTPGTGPASTPAAAELVSVGATDAAGGVSRKMEALVRMTAVPPAGALDKAIFSNNSLAPTNNVTVNGNVGNDGNVYTNGNYTCNNNQTIKGSVFAQGTMTANNNCSVVVDVYAKGNVVASNNANVGHDMKSSTGNITMNNNAKVNHDAIAHGTNTGGTVLNSRVSGATLADPPSQVFPTINFDSTAWSNAGYTRQINDAANCAQAYADVLAMNVQTTPTVIQTTCLLTWSNNTTISLKTNLTIFSTAGFSMNNNFTVKSTDTNVRKFYLIVPTSAGGSCTGGNPGLSFNNNSSFASTINDFFFTPCTISINNNDSGYGQIYAGTVNLSNNFTQHYIPASVPGVTYGGSGTTTYTNDLIYKREVTA